MDEEHHYRKCHSPARAAINSKLSTLGEPRGGPFFAPWHCSRGSGSSPLEACRGVETPTPYLAQ